MHCNSKISNAMNRLIIVVLMLCLTLSGALCFASGAARTENGKGEGTILTKKKTQHGGTDKTGSIMPSINGKVLSVVFTENLGQVAVEVASASGAAVESLMTPTPDGVLIYIPQAGDYVVTFTLANGDEYCGEFTVTD